MLIIELIYLSLIYLLIQIDHLILTSLTPLAKLLVLGSVDLVVVVVLAVLVLSINNFSFSFSSNLACYNTPSVPTD